MSALTARGMRAWLDWIPKLITEVAKGKNFFPVRLLHTLFSLIRGHKVWRNLAALVIMTPTAFLTSNWSYTHQAKTQWFQGVVGSIEAAGFEFREAWAISAFIGCLCGTTAFVLTKWGVQFLSKRPVEALFDGTTTQLNNTNSAYKFTRQMWRAIQQKYQTSGLVVSSAALAERGNMHVLSAESFRALTDFDSKNPPSTGAAQPLNPNQYRRSVAGGELYFIIKDDTPRRPRAPSNGGVGIEIDATAEITIPFNERAFEAAYEWVLSHLLHFKQNKDQHNRLRCKHVLKSMDTGNLKQLSIYIAQYKAGTLIAELHDCLHSQVIYPTSQPASWIARCCQSCTQWIWPTTPQRPPEIELPLPGSRLHRKRSLRDVNTGDAKIGEPVTPPGMASKRRPRSP